jgi:gliding motility-associated-like protein
MKKIIFILLLLISNSVISQPCFGPITYTITPPPINNNYYLPNTNVQICVTLNSFTMVGINWFEGFDFNLSNNWNSVTPLSFPVNCNGGVGNWVWVNQTTSTVFPFQSFGPGFFFESGIGMINGINDPLNPGDDFGDQGNCVWTFCINATVGNNIGGLLNFNVIPLADNVAGSYTGNFPCPPDSVVLFPNIIIGQPCPTYNLQPITDSLICYNENQMFTMLDTSNLVFTWTLTPPGTVYIGDSITIPYQNILTSNLSVFATDTNDCNSDTIDVDLLFLPNISNIIGPTEFCDTTYNQLYYVTTPDSLYSFTWYLGSQLVGNVDSVNIDLLTYGYNAITLIGDNMNCSVDTSVSILVKTPPTQLTLDPICFGFPTQLKLSGEDTINWSGQYVNNDILTPPRSGNYILDYVINVDTCSYNGITSILVKDNPLLLSISDMSNQTIELCDNNKTKFNYTIVGDEEVNYTWALFKNGSVIKRGSQPIFQYDFDKIGVYELTVITEKDGCLSDVSLVITVEPCKYTTFFVPNSFSPNDDGLNDLFQPKGIYFKDLTISLFNRWGEKIYESNDLSGWDGTYNGFKSPQGIYFYEIVYKDINNHSKRLVGNLTLYR